MNNVVSDYLLNLGFVPNKMGYRYIREIIEDALNGEEILPLKFVAYKKLSETYGKPPSCIEKDIQNAVSAAWLKGDINELYKEFGETIDMKKGKPSNKQFILTAVNSLMTKIS